MNLNFIFFKNNLLKQKNITIFISIIVVFTSILTATDGGDFDVYLDAAQKLNAQKNIYMPPFIKGLQYYYSIFFAWILTPFCNYFFVTELVWSILSYFLLYRTFRLVKEYFNITLFRHKEYEFWVCSILFFSFQFILYNVSMIQVTFFLIWAIFESLSLIFKGKNTLGGFLLGMAINIKLMPILLLPYLFYRGYFKAFFATILTTVLLLFVPAFTIGWDYNLFLLQEWWAIINPSNKEHLFETFIGTHSLVALIPVYLTDTLGELEYKRNFINLNHETVEIITNVFRVLFLSLSLFFFKSLPFKKEKNKLKMFWEISYFVLLIPMLLPHQQKYNFLLVIPMISYLIYFFIRINKVNKSPFYKYLLYFFILCLVVYSPIYGSDVIGIFLFRYTQHFRLLSILTIFLIPISIYCSPQKLFELTKKVD